MHQLRVYIGSAIQVPLAFSTLLLLFTLNYICYTQILPLLPRFTLLLRLLNIPLFLLLLYNFFACSLRDPGAIPSGSVSVSDANRKIRQHEQIDRFKYVSQEAYEMDEVVDDNLETSREVYRPSRANEDAEAETMTGVATVNPERYCDSCKIVKQVSTRHCKACGVCVRDQDCHCGVLANCIGRRNVRNYFLLLLAVYFLDIGYIVTGIAVIYYNPHWYFKTLQPQLKLQSNDFIWLLSALGIYLISRMTARRMRLLRILAFIFLVGTILYLKKKAQIQVTLESRVAGQILAAVIISYIILPIIGRNCTKILASIIFMTSYTQDIQTQNDGLKLSIICRNLKKFIFTPPTVSLV